MTRRQALNLANRYAINLDVDFHVLSSSEVERVLEAAKEARYRAPKNRNGSRARYFHAALCRAANREQ